MIQPRDETHRALKRMLANGPLTAVPKRPADQQLLVELAATQFDPDRVYREGEVNDTLIAWIETFCEPDGIDHVTLRRMLVDSRLMTRTSSGSTYQVNRARAGELEALKAVDPRTVLDDIRSERETRKRHRPA